MTAGERLRQLAGQGGTAAALLLLIGSGATAGAALADYSGLPAGTAMEHLLAEAVPPELTFGEEMILPRRVLRRPKEDDEAFLLAVLI